MKQLSIPFRSSGVLYTKYDDQAPTVDVLGETQRLVSTAGLFQGMRHFCAGCITSFETEDGQIVDDPISIKSLIPKMYYKSAEAAAIGAVLKHYDDDDGIEGMYPCPMCGNVERAELVIIDGIQVDTRDHVTDLAVRYFDIEHDNLIIHRDFTEPVLLINKMTNELIEDGEITSVDVEIPTLENCIAAESKVGIKDAMKIQPAVYVEALRKVNGRDIDTRYRQTYGPYIFGNIRAVKKDLAPIAHEINRYGIDKTKEKTCKKCGKVWRAVINTSNFFDSGLPIY